MTTKIEVHLLDGRVIRGQADFGKGSPAMPMDWDEVVAKFEGCAAFGGLPRAAAAEVVALVADLPALPEVGRLTALLRRHGAGPT